MFSSITKYIRTIRYGLGLEMGMYANREKGDLILMYHNIFPHSLPGLNVRNIGQREFSEELTYLSKRFRIVSLAEMMETPADGRRLAMTFDDGLANNMKYAQRILEQHRVPATFFVCTAYLRGRSILWPDHLAMTGFHAGQPIEWKGVTYRRRKANRYISDEGKRLTHVLMKEPWSELQRFMDSSEEQTGYKPSDDTRHEYRWRVMRAEEVRIMAESPFVEIGSHGITHANFSMLTHEEARTELAESKSYLESASGTQIHSFAWPFGIYTSHAVQLARECGYTRQLAVALREQDAETHSLLHPRTGLFNDRSWIERMHLVNKTFANLS